LGLVGADDVSTQTLQGGVVGRSLAQNALPDLEFYTVSPTAFQNSAIAERRAIMTAWANSDTDRWTLDLLILVEIGMRDEDSEVRLQSLIALNRVAMAANIARLTGRPETVNPTRHPSLLSALKERRYSGS
jgi:hypothetical protein